MVELTVDHVDVRIENESFVMKLQGPWGNGRNQHAENDEIQGLPPESFIMSLHA